MLPFKTLLNLQLVDFVRLSRGTPSAHDIIPMPLNAGTCLFASICVFRLKALQVSVPSRQARPHSCERAHHQCFMSECAESMQCLSHPCLRAWPAWAYQSSLGQFLNDSSWLGLSAVLAVITCPFSQSGTERQPRSVLIGGDSRK